jgi:hypothetical protein
MMPSKTAIIAITGIAASIVLLSAAAVVDGPKLATTDWRRFNFSFHQCKPVPGATANMRSLDWRGGNQVRVSLPANVHYRRGEGDRLVISGDPQTVAQVDVEDGRIRLDCDNADGRLEITLPGREFRSFRVSGSANLDLSDLDQASVELRISGSGSIRANGKVEDARVRISGSGDAQLGQLTAKDIDLEVSGSGNAEIAPQDRARLKVSGSGDIRLLTDPRSLDTRVSGSGRIIHAQRENI